MYKNEYDLLLDSDFKVYNNCLISAVAPHEVPDNKNIVKELKLKKCYFARWTDNFDKLVENPDNKSNWYYVIKDDDYDITKLKSKYRNMIKVGKNNFSCKFINPNDYEDEIYNIYLKMNEILPKNSRSKISKEKFCDFKKNSFYIGAFDLENNKLCGYAILENYHNSTECINFTVLRYLPEKRNKNINAAIIDFMCDYYLHQNKFKYICDGERSIRHDTTFQDYLIKYFGFRKVYCDLHIVYSKKIYFIIKILYPFKKFLKLFDKKIRFIHSLYALLLQEEIVRNLKY